MKRTLVCADTSYLFSIYNNNEHSSKAFRLLRRLATPITISVLNEYELGCALRLSEFAGEIRKGSAENYLAQFEADVQDGRLELRKIDLDAVFAKATALSNNYVMAMGSRSYDMLHVASALVLGATTFVTFDRVQQKLALAEGLKSPW